MDRHALTCPCTCHGRGPDSPCDPQFPSGCGHLHTPDSAPPADACPGCGRPTGDHSLCPSCTGTLASDLAQVPGLLQELEVYRAKLDRIGERSPRGGSHMPLGYRPMAVEVTDVLHLTLASWAREVATAAGVPLLEVPAEHPGALAVWLAAELEVARHMTTAGQLLDEVGYAVRITRRTIDRPEDRVYAGPCDECPADLYASARSSTVECRNCGALYPVQERRAWLLGALREHLATAAEIAMGLGELYGQTVNRKTINQWHHRDRLIDRGFTRDGWPLFRIGDVLDLAEASATRQAG